VNKDYVQRYVIFALGIAFSLITAWNTYLHSSMQANRDGVQEVRLEMAKNYVSTEDMDKFISRMEKRFDRLDAKIDSK